MFPDNYIQDFKNQIFSDIKLLFLQKKLECVMYMYERKNYKFKKL